jgi:hypothetical protein
MTKWLNDDGLTVLFEDDANDAKAGSPRTHGVEKELHIEIEDGVNVPAVADNATPVSDQPDAFIPAGAIVTGVACYVTTDFTSGGVATIDIGTEEQDGTAITTDGIVAAETATDIIKGFTAPAAGGHITSGVALTKDAFITIEVNTAEVTAGKALFVIKYIIPKT